MANNRKSTRGRINQYAPNTALVNTGTINKPKFEQVSTGTYRLIQHISR
jgi:hypothetical protein